MKYFVILLFVCFTILNLSAEWELQTSGVGDNLYGTHFIDEDYGFVVGWGASSGAVALRTVNGGLEWDSTILSNGAFVFSVTFTDPDHGYAAGCLNGGASGAVFKTSNGGDSWSYSNFSATYGLYDVEFADTDIGYACGWLGKIYKTTNGGSSWAPVSSGTSDVLRWMSIVDENTGYIVGGSNWNNPNRLFKMTNGSNWSSVHTFSGSVIGGVHFFDADTGIVCGGNNGEFIEKTYDGGDTWVSKYSSNSGLFQSIQFDENGTGWACGNNGRVVRSEDFGETWIEDDPTVPASTLLGIYGTDNAVYTVGTNGNIFKQELDASIIADFSAEPISGIAPLTVQFTDLSIGTPFLWWWDFDNSGDSESYEQNPEWTYTEPGIYSVSFTVNDGLNQDIEVKHNYIEVLATSSDENIIPEELALMNYPNPFNPETTISFQIPNTSNISLSIYNIRGQLVKDLVNDELPGGFHSLIWKGEDNKDLPVGSGIYLYKLQTDNKTFMKRMILLR